MAEYLIQGATLEAAADKIRECLGQEKIGFDPAVINGDGTIDPGTIMVHFQEWVDSSDNYGDGDTTEVEGSSDEFIAYDFLANDKGVLTPVILKTDIYGDEPETPDYNDLFYYEGQAEIDGMLFDKWRKIEMGNQALDWLSDSKKYIYTDIIVLNNSLSPSDLPNKIQEVYNAGVSSSGGGSSNTPTVTQATPSISVSASGLITASATQGEGYVAGGTKTATKQLDTKPFTYIVPGVDDIIAVGTGVYTTGNIKVAGDIGLQSRNIRKGTSLFGVPGSLLDGESIIKKYAPMIIQADNAPVIANSYNGISTYSQSVFRNKTIEGINFDYRDVVTSEITADEESLGTTYLKVANASQVCYVKTYLYCQFVSNDLGQTKTVYKEVILAPNSTTKITLPLALSNSPDDWYHEIQFLKWSLTEPVAEMSEE